MVTSDNNSSGRKAAKNARDAFRAQGRQANSFFPDAVHEDLNDQLRGITTAVDGPSFGYQ